MSSKKQGNAPNRKQHLKLRRTSPGGFERLNTYNPILKVGFYRFIEFFGHEGIALIVGVDWIAHQASFAENTLKNIWNQQCAGFPAHLFIGCAESPAIKGDTYTADNHQSAPLVNGRYNGL